MEDFHSGAIKGFSKICPACMNKKFLPMNAMRCPKCEGSSKMSGGLPMKCKLCNGTGVTYDYWNKCDLCRGEGNTGILKKCDKCNGTGFLKAGMMGQGMGQPGMMMNQPGMMNLPGIMGQPRLVNQQLSGGYSGPMMGQPMGQQIMEQQPMMNQPSMGGKNRKSKKIWIFFIIFYFVYNAIRFINSEGNEYPIFWTLFNMIICLGIFMLIQHKQEIMENKKFKQSLLTDFYKRIK